MKIVLYDDDKVGLLKDGDVVDVSTVVPRGGTPQFTIEAHSIEESPAWMISMVTLKPGDLFFLGTNHQSIGPLQDGEHAVIEIDRMGRLEFNVRDPLRRRWPKEIDEVSAQDVRQGTGEPGRRARPLG